MENKKIKIEELKKYFESLKKTYIVNIAENKNGVFKGYKYFTIERNNFYYYIEFNDNFVNDRFLNITITAYKKITFNKKRQIRYPKIIYSLKDCLNYIKETEKKDYFLKDAYNQSVTFDFDKYKEINEKEYKNIFERINPGYREKEILKNIKTAEMIQNDGIYKIYKIIDNKNNYFEIDVKRLKIIG